ncbi:MAG: hypothetical protein AAB467_05270, partial [Patescibacteria group bacterium]
IKEYETYDRSRRWYFVMVAIGLLLIAYAMMSANYLFALVVILFGIVLYVHEMQEAIDVYFAITETGIIIGRKFYRFSELEGFWLIYNPPEVKNLYFRLKNVVRFRVKIPLLDFDPRPIREYIKQFLTEETEHEEEPLSDRLARVFKIH